MGFVADKAAQGRVLSESSISPANFHSTNRLSIMSSCHLTLQSLHTDSVDTNQQKVKQEVLGRDCLCGLVVRVPGYRSRNPGFDSRRYQIFWEVVGLERGPLSLVRITEELLEWKSSGSGSRKPRLTAVVIRSADQATPSIHKSWH
jgi:hypothetical protein